MEMMATTNGSRIGRLGNQLHQENIHLLFYLSTLRKKRVFLYFTPPENEFGINFFWILGPWSTCRLFNSYESKKVSGRFPDCVLFHSDQFNLKSDETVRNSLAPDVPARRVSLFRI